MDSFQYKFVIQTVTAASVVTTNEPTTGWDWVIIEFSTPASAGRVSVDVNGNIYHLWLMTGMTQSRILRCQVDVTQTVTVKTQQVAGGVASYIINVARGWPIPPVS